LQAYFVDSYSGVLKDAHTHKLGRVNPEVLELVESGYKCTNPGAHGCQYFIRRNRNADDFEELMEDVEVYLTRANVVALLIS
jgi:hypothetical protein